LLSATFLIPCLVGMAPSLGQEAGSYRIGPKDLLSVSVFEVPELNVERRVSELGMLDLPLVGGVDVEGLTEAETSAKLKKLLESRYVQQASVEVHIKEFQSRPISVVGAVRHPGALAFPGKWTLLEVLAAAGGLEERHGDVIHVLRRRAAGATEELSVNVEDLLVRGNEQANIAIYPNDIINVPTAVNVTVFCLGEVRHGGALVFREGERMTLLTVIAKGGGLTDRASKKIIIKRTRRDGTPENLTGNYKRIVAGKDPDIELRKDDVVLVKESFF